jgi:hypothetical protein
MKNKKQGGTDLKSAVLVLQGRSSYTLFQPGKSLYIKASGVYNLCTNLRRGVLVFCQGLIDG